MKRFYIDINLMGNQFINGSFEKLTADPTSDLFSGRMYYNTTDEVIKYYDATKSEWIAIGDTSAVESILSSLSTLQSNIDSGQDSVISEISDGLSTIEDTVEDHASSISSIVAEFADADSETISSIIDAIDNVIPSDISEIGDTVDDVSTSQVSISSIQSEILSEITDINSDISEVSTALSTHVADTDNPHAVTLEDARSENNQLAGNIDMNSNTIEGLPNPVEPDEAANKAYVDAVAAGLKVRQHVEYATYEPLTADYAIGQDPGDPAVGATLTNTGTNEALIIDVLTTDVGDRILVKNQANALHNGIYIVTEVGDETTSWVLTRSGEFDDSPNPELLAGDFFFVRFGTNNGMSGWVVQPYNNNDPTVGTDPINFTQFSGAGTYAAGSGIDIDGVVISVDGSEIAGTGLEQVPGTGNEHQVQVTRYTPVNNANVARTRTFTDQSITSDTAWDIVHNFGGPINAIVYDEADNKVVEVEITYQNNNTLRINSSVSFTGTVVING